MNKKINTVHLSIGLIAFLYVLIRAIKLEITYDEAWTIKSYVSQRVTDILRCTSCIPNNHILNTLLIKLCFSFGFKSLFIGRLPNVLAFIFYLYFLHKITNNYLSKFLGFASFLLLIINPFLLDFFSIARGYGLALGFQMASLYYLISFTKKNDSTDGLFSLSMGSLAVLCNFSLLNYWFGILLYLSLYSFVSRKIFNYKKLIAGSIMITIALAFFIYQPLSDLVKNNEFTYGGTSGFITDTLVSLMRYSLYGSKSPALVIASLAIFLSILVGTILFHFFKTKRLSLANNPVLYVLIFCILSTILQHYLFGTLYVIDRAALFFYSLFILSFSFSISDYFNYRFSKFVVAFLALLFGINFLVHANLQKTALWYFDAHTTEILDWINKKGAQANKKLKLDFSWPFDTSIEYYYAGNKYPFIEIVKNPNNREDLNAQADYYIYLNQSLPKDWYDASDQKIVLLKKDTSLIYLDEGILVFSNIRPR